VALHPDKIIALSRIANGASPTDREPVPSETVEQRAINAAITRRQQALPKEPGAIDDLAYDLRGMHWANHLKRLKKKVNQSNAPKQQKPQPPQIVFQLPGQMNG
jgi:hypothetical protein